MRMQAPKINEYQGISKLSIIKTVSKASRLSKNINKINATESNLSTQQGTPRNLIRIPSCHSDHPRNSPRCQNQYLK